MSDLAPVDATSTEGRLALTSFIWPDHLKRFERLRRALEVSGGIDVSLVTADALDYVRGLELTVLKTPA